MAEAQMQKIAITNPTRPCYVNGTKAIFHRWVDKSWIVPPGIAVGSHKGGTIRETLALIELEDGSVAEVYPSQITFADGGNFKDTEFRPYRTE